MTIEDLEHNARKALLCLYLATDRAIADNVNELVLAYIDALKAKLAEVEEQADALEMGYRGFP